MDVRGIVRTSAAELLAVPKPELFMTQDRPISPQGKPGSHKADHGAEIAEMSKDQHSSDRRAAIYASTAPTASHHSHSSERL